jgi:hypothetical protein
MAAARTKKDGSAAIGSGSRRGIVASCRPFSSPGHASPSSPMRGQPLEICIGATCLYKLLAI